MVTGRALRLVDLLDPTRPRWQRLIRHPRFFLRRAILSAMVSGKDCGPRLRPLGHPKMPYSSEAACRSSPSRRSSSDWNRRRALASFSRAAGANPYRRSSSSCGSGPQTSANCDSTTTSRTAAPICCLPLPGSRHARPGHSHQPPVPGHNGARIPPTPLATLRTRPPATGRGPQGSKPKTPLRRLLAGIEHNSSRERNMKRLKTAIGAADRVRDTVCHPLGRRVKCRQTKKIATRSIGMSPATT